MQVISIEQVTISTHPSLVVELVAAAEDEIDFVQTSRTCKSLFDHLVSSTLPCPAHRKWVISRLTDERCNGNLSGKGEICG
jgi:hypothetical protein